MGSNVREARLKPEFAHLYPPITPGEWTPAAELGARLLVWHLQQEKRSPMRERLLDSGHFEFRGGEARGRTEVRTRVGESDPPARRSAAH